MVRLPAAILAACLPLLPAKAAQPPLGLWSTPNLQGVIQVAPCGAELLCGTIIGVTPSPEGVFPRDITGVPQCRLILFNHLKAEDDGRWHGTVRNPEDGQVYNAEVWIGPDGNLRLRGYIGIELFGQTQTWLKFNGTVQPDCRFRLAAR